WRTRLVGPTSRLHFTGGLARVSDMAIFGETSVRNDLSDAENALSGVPGPGSKVERVWIEHKKCGFWFGVWNQSPAPAGITLDGLRIRDTMADGVNLCSGTTDTVVENCLVRNTGDDGLAVWSPTAGGPSGGGNQFRGNLVQLPWLANGIAVYGGGARGQGGVILDQNEVRDTVTTGSGIYVAQAFSSWPLTGAVTISRNILVRAGAHESDVGGSAGAIRIVSSEGSLAAATVTFSDNRIVAPLASAVSIQGGYSVGNLTFTNLLIENLGLALVADVRSGTKGSATFSGVTGGTFADALWVNSAGTAFTLSH
ncbi:MAG TPA: right-handed parallel beta-helix repeat-containing protein, partial [Spirochaetia bacterium]|nr:right-handed parallel beta-helix repeat-containing protein [Spirochaetia bacterium]